MARAMATARQAVGPLGGRCSQHNESLVDDEYLRSLQAGTASALREITWFQVPPILSKPAIIHDRSSAVENPSE